MDVKLYPRTYGRRDANGITRQIPWKDVEPGDFVILAGRRFQISDVKVSRTASGSIRNRLEWKSRKYGYQGGYAR